MGWGLWEMTQSTDCFYRDEGQQQGLAMLVWGQLTEVANLAMSALSSLKHQS